MADFEAAVSYVLQNEGGFVEDPADSGKATNFGITLAELAAWRKTGVSSLDVKALTLEEAKQIYHAHYWIPMGLDSEIPQSVATAILDAAVNQGVGNTSMHVQNVVAGFQTKMLAAIDARRFLAKFIPVVQNHYVWIVVKNPFQVKFLKGWMARSQRLLGLMV